MIHISDKNGEYDTELGKLKVRVTKVDTLGRLKQLVLEADFLKGKLRRNYWKRRRIRTIDLSSGYGRQDISKRETLIVYPDGYQKGMPSRRALRFSSGEIWPKDQGKHINT